jgi:single-strand DNA-binding protein
MNSINLVGRMTKTPELRYSKEGTPVTTFTIAVNRMKKDEADFLNCVSFKKTAENIANFTDKGSLIAVSGSIQTRNYENNEGKRVYVTEIIANQVTFLDSKKKEDKPQQQTKKEYDPFAGSIDIDTEGLPF